MNQEQFQQLFTVMQQQQQALTEANSILRQELSDQSTRFAAAQTQSDRNMAAMLEAMSPDKSIEHSGILHQTGTPSLTISNLRLKTTSMLVQSIMCIDKLGQAECSSRATTSTPCSR